MYNNSYYIVQYKALLLLCEKDYDLMINVRLYHEIVLPFFNLKHGQFAAHRDRIIGKEHTKVVQNHKKFDTQLQTAQLSARQQIDNRIDQNMTGLDAKVKSIKRNSSSQLIKKEAIAYDEALFDDDITFDQEQSQPTKMFHPSSSSSKRFRQPETVSPPFRRKPKPD